jgi:hypothetical protein
MSIIMWVSLLHHRDVDAGHISAASFAEAKMAQCDEQSFISPMQGSVADIRSSTAASEPR